MEYGLKKILMAFILLTIGLSLLTITADSIASATTISTVDNENVIIASGSGTAANEDITSVSYFGNSTINTSIVGISFNTQVNWTPAGVLTVDQGNFSDGTYQFTYEYQGTEYINNGTSRTLVKLIPLFFALAIIGIAVVFGISGFRDMGFMSKN